MVDHPTLFQLFWFVCSAMTIILEEVIYQEMFCMSQGSRLTWFVLYTKRDKNSFRGHECVVFQYQPNIFQGNQTVVQPNHTTVGYDEWPLPLALWEKFNSHSKLNECFHTYRCQLNFAMSCKGYRKASSRWPCTMDNHTVKLLQERALNK